MENMAAGDSIGKEAECEDFVINIPPDLPPAKWEECCIYRIPKKLCEVNKKAYTPKLVSIGPFHYHQGELKNMKIHKLRYLRDFCRRTGTRQEDLLKIIKDNEITIRRCYSETFEHSREEFVKMILLDAIFIIELFLRKRGNEEKVKKNEEEEDYILSTPWLRFGIQNDLILLENQLPFFVLEQLYMFALCDEDKNDLKKQDAPFVKLSCNYFFDYDEQVPESIIGKQVQESIIGKEVKHFTDLQRYWFCSDFTSKPRPRGHLDNVYCATKLDNSGLKFTAPKNTCLLEITFPKNYECPGLFSCINLSWLFVCLPCLKCFPRLEHMQSILEVPPLNIYDNTEALFRNLMALEQCHYPFQTYICDYVALIDYLIDTEKDVELLVDKNIIVNNIGSNAAVVTLFNRLCLEIVVNGSCYSALGEEINNHYENHWNRILATLISVYFRDFWRGTATVGGLIVFCFTFWNFLKPFVI